MTNALICFAMALINVPGMLDGKPFSIFAFGFCLACGIGCIAIDNA